MGKLRFDDVSNVGFEILEISLEKSSRDNMNATGMSHGEPVDH